MHVNVGKTKVMVFGSGCNTRWRLVNLPIFTYNNEEVEVVDEFKYLGVIFHFTGSYLHALNYRLAQAKRSFAIWWRKCHAWKFSPDIALLLFKIYVVPALEYGVGLWGAGDRFCSMKRIWESQLELFFRQAARFILGVPLRTPTVGIYAELGMLPFWTRAGWQTASLWARAVRAGPQSLIGKAMFVQRSNFLLNRPCWLRYAYNSLHKLGFGKMIWSEWDSACAIYYNY